MRRVALTECLLLGSAAAQERGTPKGKPQGIDKASDLSELAQLTARAETGEKYAMFHDGLMRPVVAARARIDLPAGLGSGEARAAGAHGRLPNRSRTCESPLFANAKGRCLRRFHLHHSTPNALNACDNLTVA